MISSGQLVIPSHISILHVEQEVTGDDTVAVQSVLESDERREALMKEEKEISDKLNSAGWESCFYSLTHFNKILSLIDYFVVN